MLNDGTSANICDAKVYDFFGDSMSSSEKNDHMFHVACIDLALKCENDKRKEKNQCKILANVYWIDNYPTQCKCRQNFNHTSSQPTRDPNTDVIHKFAEVYHFKGF